MKRFGDHPGACRLELQVERCCFDGCLLVAGQPRQAVSKGVGDAEVHTVVGASVRQAAILARDSLRVPNRSDG